MLPSITEAVCIAMGFFQWQNNVSVQVIKSDDYSHIDVIFCLEQLLGGFVLSR